MKQIRYILWGIAFIAIGIFLITSLPVTNDNDSTVTSFMAPAGYNQGTHFSLTTHTNKPFNSKTDIQDFALIFFGFTHCPAICPTELQKMATVLDILDQDTKAKLTPIFITIDPERDTVDVMQSYIPQFHEKIIGLTGNAINIKAVLDGWKVYAAKVNDPQFSDYTMDHSTYSYLVDSDMNIKALFRLKTTAPEIATVITSIIDESTNKAQTP